MDWVQRAIENGAAIVARIITEQYIKNMKSLGYDSVDIVSDNKNPGPNNSKVYCHRSRCIVDSNAAGFYMIHTSDCHLNNIDDKRVEVTNSRAQAY